MTSLKIACDKDEKARDAKVRRSRVAGLGTDVSSEVKTVGTRSAQVWLSKDVEELGWDRGPVIVAGMDAHLRGAGPRPPIVAATRPGPT